MTEQYKLVDDGVFAAVRQILVARTGKGLTEDDVRLINAALALDDPPAPAINTNGVLNSKAVLELMTHEAIIRELYKDSVGVSTWSAGITSASGINVEQYKDKPTDMQTCVNAVVDRLRKVYVPQVVAAFPGRLLKEYEFAAALSFHYNTGAIGRADWVKLWLAGRVSEAYIDIMNWKSPPEIVERRKKERELFFNGKWTQDGKVTTYEVVKPSYAPRWSSAKRVDVTAEVKKALGA